MDVTAKCIFGILIVSNRDALEAVNTAKLTIISWTCYPIVWALCEGADIVSVNVSCLLYTIMDVTAKCVFGILIVSNRDALEAVNRSKRNQGVEAVPFMKEEN